MHSVLRSEAACSIWARWEASTAKAEESAALARWPDGRTSRAERIIMPLSTVGADPSISAHSATQTETARPTPSTAQVLWPDSRLTQQARLVPAGLELPTSTSARWVG